MQKLIEGHKRFLAEVFPAKKSQFHLLAESQAPAWLFITCADSRVVPDLILGTEPGDLFIARSIGNVVPVRPRCGRRDGHHRVLRGRAQGKARHCLRPLRLRSHEGRARPHKLVNLPKARRWLDHVESAFAHRQPLNPADGEHAELASLIRGNVVAQLTNLREQPPVARAIAEGRLTVHGWYYDILTGRIEEYDEGLKKFATLV